MSKEAGVDSLITLSNLGVNANAFTTNNFTAYLYECTENFYEALDEFMDYVQNPYYTHENVEKERGIIEQEISMYDDEPEWQLYLNAVKCMYQKNPVRLDIAGTKRTIADIDENTLYTIYNNFYVPENMAIVVVGDFKPEEILNEIKKRMTKQASTTKITRVTEDEPDEIFEPKKEVKMEISMPIFMLGYKAKKDDKDRVKRELALDILGNIIFGKSSNLYQKLYDEGLIYDELGYEFEHARDYAHFIVQGASDDPEKVIEKIRNEIDYFLNQGLDEKDFSRSKKKVYGDMIRDFNEVQTIGNLIISDYFKDINIFDYFEEFESISKEYAEQVLRETFCEDKKVVSIVRSI